MLDVKEAAQKAADYFAGLFSDRSLSKVQLEEVELTEDGQHWLITLSYPASELDELFGRGMDRREYKQFKIDARSGQVKSMKIRKV